MNLKLKFQPLDDIKLLFKNFGLQEIANDKEWIRIAKL